MSADVHPEGSPRGGVKQQDLSDFVPRAVCWACRRALANCYCPEVVSFDAGIDVALLVHPREARNPVGTARIAHRFLRDSLWLECAGRAIDSNGRFREWLAARTGRVSVLYPGPAALSVAEWKGANEARRDEGRPAVVVLDGTWAQARQMMRQSAVLRSLPQLSFQTDRRSAYQIREQPQALCLSSLEAIHEFLLQLGGDRQGPQRMLDTFLKMVAFQLAKGGPAGGKTADRGRRTRI